MSDQDLLARTTSILRNALTELEGTVSANRTITNNNVGDPHGVSVGASSGRERASDNFRSVHNRSFTRATLALYTRLAFASVCLKHAKKLRLFCRLQVSFHK
jgi:hypothetical protein